MGNNDFKNLYILLGKKAKYFIYLFIFFISLSSFYIFNKRNLYDTETVYDSNIEDFSIKKPDLTELLKKTHLSYLNSDYNNVYKINKNFQKWFKKKVILKPLKDKNFIKFSYISRSPEHTNKILDIFDKNLRGFNFDYFNHQGLIQEKLNTSFQDIYLFNNNQDINLIISKIKKFQRKFPFKKNYNFSDDLETYPEKINLSNNDIKILKEYLSFLENFNLNLSSYQKFIYELNTQNKLNNFSPVKSVSYINLTNKKLTSIFLLFNSFLISLIIFYGYLIFYTKVDNFFIFKSFTSFMNIKILSLSEKSVWLEIFNNIIRSNSISKETFLGIFFLSANPSKIKEEFSNLINKYYEKNNFAITSNIEDLKLCSSIITVYIEDELSVNEIRNIENKLIYFSVNIISSIYFSKK